jgi:peptidoglycan/xylan/chitin deacetylase (PgdA/CDA1 family)
MNKAPRNKPNVAARLFKLVGSLVFYAGDWMWRRLKQAAGREPPGTCVVLYYHAVPAEHRAGFANQMSILVRRSQPVRTDFSGTLASGVRHSAIAFHDAFVSVWDNALPELDQRGVPSTIFVPSGCLGQRPRWIEDERHSDYGEAVIDVDRLRSVDASLVSVGSHSVTHPDLSLLSQQEAREELNRSKIELEAIVGRPVRLFAFPYGIRNEALTELCREVGYQRVFTIEPRLAFSKPDEYVTGSCPVSAADWELEFRLKLLGAYRWLPAVYRLKGRTARTLRRRSFQAEQVGPAVGGTLPHNGTRERESTPQSNGS